KFLRLEFQVVAVFAQGTEAARVHPTADAPHQRRSLVTSEIESASLLQHEEKLVELLVAVLTWHGPQGYPAGLVAVVVGGPRGSCLVGKFQQLADLPGGRTGGQGAGPETACRHRIPLVFGGLG